MSIVVMANVLTFPLKYIAHAKVAILEDFKFKRLYITFVIAIYTGLMGGCSSSPKQQKIDEGKIKQFANHGYDSEIEYATSISRLSLNIGSGFCPVTIVQPVREGKYPLVIYLPGLGESSDAGKNLRNAWATSGYVVLSIQPLNDDENIWSSAAARSGDFAYIRHERYSSEVIFNRLNILAKLFEYLKQSAISSDTNLQHIDLSHIAIVGFDIGASSAMIVAGEDVPNITNGGFPVRMDVAIALSPYADFSSPAFSVRYRNINVPVLSVTSDSDTDMGGSLPSLHQAPFQYMPTGNKYLLLLAGASHYVIGNGSPPKIEGEGNRQKDETGGNIESSGSESGSRHGRKSSTRGGASGSSSMREGGGSPTQRAIMEVALEKVTTAFLNAYIKSDQFSMEWLKNDAQPWLLKIGQLKEK